MKTMLVLALLVFLFVVLKAIADAKRKKPDINERYVAKPLLTENEKAWFNTLKEAVPHAHVFGQVALNQLVTVENKERTSSTTIARNHIATRSIDFVLLNPDLAVLVAIEIDDKSHREKRRQKEDAQKSKALASAGITLLRFAAMPVLPAEEVKKRIVEAIAAKMQAKLQS